MKELKVVNIERKRDVTNLDIRKISENGFYKENKNATPIRLTDEEIDTLRSFHRNPKIAKNRLKKDLRVTVKVYNNDNRKKRLVLDKTPKQIRRRPIEKGYKELIKTISLSLLIAGSITAGFNSVNIAKEEPIKIYSEKNNKEVKKNAVISKVNHKADLAVKKDDYIDQEMIKKYCDIYQVNEEIVSKILEKLTNNYTSNEYKKNCNISGIVCKFKQVQPSSYEELLAYVVRNIKQDPTKFGLNPEEIYINNGYQSNKDYMESITHFSNLFGLDKCLVAAIVQSECGFDSSLFNDINNPAGLRINKDEWWSFPTKEAGFIEFCLELVKYYNEYQIEKVNGFYPVDNYIISLIRDKHAPLSDGNYYWLDNVIQCYQDLKSDYNFYYNIEEKAHTI